jgi:hypothetical protein
MGTDKLLFEGEQWGATGHFDPHFALQLLAKRGGVSHNVPLDALFFAFGKPHSKSFGSSMHVTGSDVSHMTRSNHVRKYIMRMRNRKLCHIRPSGAF